MRSPLGQASAPAQPVPGLTRPGRLVAALRYMRRNISLVAGLLLLVTLALFVGIGHMVVDTSKSRALSVPALRPRWDDLRLQLRPPCAAASPSTPSIPS